MDVKIIKALWGHTEHTTDDADLHKIKEAGFDGVEWGPPNMPPERWKDLRAKHGLTYVAQVFALDPAEFRAQVEAVLPYEPLLIEAHDGRDKMTFDEGCAYWREVLKFEKDLPVPVAHETHRFRLFYAPWSTAQYLNEFPDLKICADFSHWCCVCESLLKDMEDWVTLACERAIHIHGRVGFEEGPQVPDPRAPEYRHHLERHEEWWDRIYELRKKDFAETLTFNPEFGPPAYMWRQPYTQMPLANLWDIGLWMLQRTRSRWER